MANANRKGNDGLTLKLVVSLLLLTLQAGIVAEALYRRGNTLHHNGRWVSQKMKLSRGVMGGTAYFLSPAALAGKRLNLHPFFGSQELYFHRALALKSLSFRFLLGDQAYLNLLYNKTPNGVDGLRLSRDSRFPSMTFRADARKLFKQRGVFEQPNQPKLNTGWNRLELRFSGEKALFKLNGESLAEVETPFVSGSFFGFRGGTRFAAIDDVEIQPTSGIAITDAFEPTGDRDWLVSVGAVLLANLVLLGLLVVFNRKKHGRGLRYFLLKAGFAVALLVVPLGLFDIFFLVQWEREPTDYLHYKADIEMSPQTLERLQRTYSKKGVDDADRIFLVGSSQLWGAGARVDEDTLTQRLASILKDKLNRPYQVMNLSINGSRSPEMLKHYQAEWLAWQPSLVVVNLGSNDHMPEVAPNMTRFATLNKERGIKTLFLLEPNSVEADDKGLAKKHEIVRQVAKSQSVPLFNMHRYLAENVDLGFFWWDSCHMTGAGQEYFARALSAEIVKILAP
jgi:lysophospholipase L1-like esterase